MATNSEIVTAFLDACGASLSGPGDAFEQWFTPATVWENVGLVTTTGADEAKAAMAQFEQAFGVAGFRVETIAIAERGGKVLTERIDHLIDRDGNEVTSLRLMGIFDVANDKITVWRDYFDTAALPKRGA